MSRTADRARVEEIRRDIGAGIRPANDPQLIDAYRDRRAERLQEHVAEIVAGWPPLSDEQKARVAALLTAGSAT